VGCGRPGAAFGTGRRRPEVDARDDTAAAFYRHHGFVRFGSAANQLLLFLANVTLPTSSVS